MSSLNFLLYAIWNLEVSITLKYINDESSDKHVINEGIYVYTVSNKENSINSYLIK